MVSVLPQIKFKIAYSNKRLNSCLDSGFSVNLNKLLCFQPLLLMLTNSPNPIVVSHDIWTDCFYNFLNDQEKIWW